MVHVPISISQSLHYHLCIHVYMYMYCGILSSQKIISFRCTCTCMPAQDMSENCICVTHGNYTIYFSIEL